MESKRVYFSNEDDVILLREVLGQNPYEEPRRWNLIHVNMLQLTGKNISPRTLKERTKKLVNKFLRKEKTQQFKSGIEEEVGETDDLLHQVAGLMNEWGKKKVTSKVAESSYEKGFQQRECAITGMEPINVEQTVASSSDGILQFPEYNKEVEVVYEVENADNVETKTNEAPNEENVKANISVPIKRTAQRNIASPARKRVNTAGIKQSTLSYLQKKKMTEQQNYALENLLYKKGSRHCWKTNLN